MVAQKKPGGYWSQANPVPTIHKFLEELDSDKKERDRKIDEQAKQKPQPQKQQEARQHGGRGEEKSEAIPHREPIAARSRGRSVTDPTTGADVEIDDVGKEFMKAVREPQLSVPNANLGLPTPIKTEASQSLEDYKYNQDVTAPPDPIASGTTSDVPIHGERTNVLFHPTPSTTFEPMFKLMERNASILCISIFTAILIAGKIAGGRVKIMFPLACCVTSAVWLWTMNLIRRGRANEWQSEKLRGQTATANLLPESVEWMNSFLGVAWGLMNPDMFTSVADTIEDVMHASLPGIIENVRIAEIDQGSNPFRIISLRSLPDGQVSDLVDGLHKHNLETKDEQDAAAIEEGGSPYNLECTFAYHAKPTGTSSAAKADNMHMMVVFYLGVKGLFGVPLPIFVELIEAVGTIRLRLQLSPEPPFAKSLTFSLMGLPHIRAGCTPMVKRGVNILNLPLISNFVNYAIGAVANMYVAPKSMSLDLGMMLGGDDVQKDTLAMGVVWVRIHRATGLSKQDKRGSEGGGSDPYINLSFSKYGKPMYCTRVICDDLNPFWEEAGALLVTPELIKADELLSVELWDSDRNTADDIVGKAELSLQKLMQQPGKMFPMVSKLRGMDVGTEMPGELHWEVGYFAKTQFRRALRTDGKDNALPDSMKDDPRLEDEKGNVDTEEEDAVTRTPPDPLWPSGVCTIVIHQIVNLQLEDIKGTLKDRKGREYEPAKPYGESTEEEGKNLPTSYCKILLNDEAVYRTRAKAVTSKPMFNAGTERFVRDWRSAMVTVTVRDQRNREHDPILGVVPLKLSNVLQNSSQVTRWYPLDGGIGFGRIRISLLFRSVDLKLPPQILGYEIGAFRITSDRISIKDYHCNSKLKIRSSGDHSTLPRSALKQHKDGGSGGYYDISSDEMKTKTLVPVKHRYRSAVIFELQDGSNPAYVIVWLQRLVDNEVQNLDLPIWTTKNSTRLVQNYITEENHELKRSPGLEDLKIVGRLQFSCLFTPGFNQCHERMVADNDTRESFESWEACVSEGVRGEIKVEIPPGVRRLHERSLLQERDVLRVDKRRSTESSQKPTVPSADGSQVPLRESYDGTSGPGRKRTSNASWPSTRIDQQGMQGVEASQNQSAEIERHYPRTDDFSAQNGSRHNSGYVSGEMGGNEGGEEDYEYSENPEDFLADDTQGGRSSEETTEERKNRIGNKANKRSEWRKQRGVMQWRPARNAAFVKHEAEFAAKKLKHKFVGDMTGREPDIETEVA